MSIEHIRTIYAWIFLVSLSIYLVITY